MLFDQQGDIAAIRHSWVFDDMYSAFVTEGLDKDGKLATPEQLAPLAEQNVEGLAEYAYFTYPKATNPGSEFGAPYDYSLEERPDKHVVLRFTLPFKKPVNPGRAFSLQIYDPTYFVAFSLDEALPISLVGAPGGCSTSVLGADPLQQADAKKLSEAFFTNMSPGTNFGIKLSSRIVVACP